MGAFLSCCNANNINGDQREAGATSEVVEIETADPFECECGGTRTEHGCIKCHVGPRCDECAFPIALEGDACMRCTEEEARENNKDWSSGGRSGARRYSGDYANSGGRI